MNRVFIFPFATFIISFFIFSFSFAQVPEEIINKLNVNPTYTEPDGLSKWEKKDDGSIIEYHFGRDDINKIYFPDGSRKVYDFNGNLILEESSEKSIFYDESGEIEEITKEGQSIIYKGGIRSKIISNDGIIDTNVATRTGDNEYTINDEGDILFVTTRDEEVVIKARFSTSFQKDFEIERVELEKGKWNLIERLINPFNDKVYWEKTTYFDMNNAVDSKVVKDGFKYSLQVFFINITGNKKELTDIQLLFDNLFK